MQVDVEEIIARIKMELQINGTHDDNYLELQCFDALRQMHDLRNYREFHARLPITNRQSVLPNNCVMLNNFSIGGHNMQPSQTTNHSNRRDANYPNGYSLDGLFINFNSDPTDGFCDVIFTGVVVDTNGRPVILDSQIDGLVAYGCYRWTVRNRGGNGNPIAYSDFKQRWYQFKHEYSSKSKMLTPEQQRYVNFLWHSMIPIRTTRYGN